MIKELTIGGWEDKVLFDGDFYIEGDSGSVIIKHLEKQIVGGEGGYIEGDTTGLIEGDYGFKCDVVKVAISEEKDFGVITGGDGEGGKWPTIIGGWDARTKEWCGGETNITKTGGIIPVIWKDTNIPKHEVPKDPTCPKQEDWFGPMFWNNHYDAAVEYGGIILKVGGVEESIDGGEGLDHEWYINGPSIIEDPTWDISGDWGFIGGGSSNISGDWGLIGHTNSFGGSGV